MGGGVIEKFEEKLLEGILLHRFGRPEDMKRAVLFLARLKLRDRLHHRGGRRTDRLAAERQAAVETV